MPSTACRTPQRSPPGYKLTLIQRLRRGHAPAYWPRPHTNTPPRRRGHAPTRNHAPSQPWPRPRRNSLSQPITASVRATWCVRGCVRHVRRRAGSGAVSRCYAAGRGVSVAVAARGPVEGTGERGAELRGTGVRRGRAVRSARRWGREEGPRALPGVLGPVPLRSERGLRGSSGRWFVKEGACVDGL